MAATFGNRPSQVPLAAGTSTARSTGRMRGEGGGGEGGGGAACKHHSGNGSLHARYGQSCLACPVTRNMPPCHDGNALSSCSGQHGHTPACGCTTGAHTSGKRRDSQRTAQNVTRRRLNLLPNSPCPPAARGPPPASPPASSWRRLRCWPPAIAGQRQSRWWHWHLAHWSPHWVPVGSVAYVGQKCRPRRADSKPWRYRRVSDL